MQSEPLNEIKLKHSFPEKAKHFFSSIYTKIKTNQPLLKATLLTLISLVFFLGIFYPTAWQSVSGIRQSWFGLGCISLYMLVSYLLAAFSSWNRLRTAAVWIQSNLLTIVSFAYFLRLSNRQIEIFGVGIDTGFLFIALTALIFVVNYNLFGKYERKQWLLLPQVVLFALQGYAFLSLTGTYVTESTNFSNDLLDLVFKLHPFMWLSLSAVSIAAVSVFTLPIKDNRKLLQFLGLFIFLMVQGILIIYLINFLDINLDLTYWNLALMALIYWDFLDSPFKSISLKLEDSRFAARLGVSTVYHAGLFLLVVLAPQLQLFFS